MPTVAMYADGNGNGVRTADMSAGLDLLIEKAVRLSDLFPRVVLSLSDPSDRALRHERVDVVPPIDRLIPHAAACAAPMACSMPFGRSAPRGGPASCGMSPAHGRGSRC